MRVNIMAEEPLKSESDSPDTDPVLAGLELVESEREELEDVGPVPEIPEGQDPSLWSNPLVTFPGGLTQRMIRIDVDVFDWFKAAGDDFEIRMNAILRKVMEEQA